MKEEAIGHFPNGRVTLSEALLSYWEVAIN